MVKIGFLVEGHCDKILLESNGFHYLLAEHGMEVCGEIVNVGGNGNFCPKNIESHIDQVKSYNPDVIFLLTDLECDPCFSMTKERLRHPSVDYYCIIKKALEAWFLADTCAMASWLDVPVEDSYEALPEETPGMPYERIKEIAKELKRNGPGDKINFAKKIINKHEFSITNAGDHPHCPSARYFLNKLKEAAQKGETHP